MVKPESGWTEAALELVLSPSPPLALAVGLELRIGVLMRAGIGAGDGARLAESGVAAEAGGKEDCGLG